MRLTSLLILTLALCLSAPALRGADAPSTAEKSSPEESVSRELMSGRVRLLSDVLKQKKIKASDEVSNQVVLVTPEGEVWPLLPDWRGRAFFQDERLRDRAVDLVVRRYPGLPYLQVLSVYTFDEKGVRMYTDYWCDICSIPMYELKDCECCQGPTRLRFQNLPLPDYIQEPEGKPEAKK
jgi:hypothetical protein